MNRYGVSVKNKWFLRLLIPYALFMFVALLLGWIIYERTLSLVDKEVSKNNLHLLQQVKMTMDRRLSEIDTIVQQLANDPRIVRLQQLKLPFEGTNTYKIWATQKDLYNFSISNNFVLNYFINYRNSDVVMAPAILYKADQFYKHVLNYGQWDYDQWHARFMDNEYQGGYIPASEATYLGKSYSIVTYQHPLGYPGHMQGSIVVLIDNNEILKLLEELDISSGGWAYIADGKGRVISGTGKITALNPDTLDRSEGFIQASKQIEGKMITYTRSTMNGWFYVLAQSPNVVLEKVHYVKRITYTTASIFFVIGIILAYFFTSRSSRTVSRLIDNNRTLQYEMEKQAPLLRATFFERLLRGDIVAGNEIRSMLQHQKLSDEIKSCAAAIIQFAYHHPYSEEMLMELDRQRVIIKEMLRTDLEDAVYSYDQAEDKIVLLFLESGRSPQQCRQRMEQLLARMSEEIRAHFNLAINVAVGGVYDSLMDVSRSYREAKHTLHFSLRQNRRGTLWVDDLPQESDSHYYPGDIETRLVNHAKTGDLQEVRLLLDDIYSRNFVDRNLSPSIQRLLIYDMTGSLMKIQEQLTLGTTNNIKSLLAGADDSDDLVDVFHIVADIYMEISIRAHDRKKSQNVRLLENILQYIHASYQNPDLNLDAAADRMSISKVYLSQFFKEQTGTNFSEYLETLRMEKACAMLAQTSITVNEIAQMTGYNSANTFCRAFKRINGISAVSYRNSVRIS